MTRARVISALVAIALIALIAWVANNTYWGDIKVPMPPKGEALTNPFYAVQRFAEALGARTAWDRVLTTPSTDSVIVLSAWHWNLIPSRREALERWVESGGRLVVDRTLADGEDEFERWSGIVREYRDPDRAEESADADHELCGRFQEEQDGTPSSGSPDTRYSMCDLDGMSFLTSKQTAVWALRDASGIQAMRVAVGRGSVTVINATPFRERSLFDGDHGWLFTAATEMRRGDDVHFMSEDDHPSLLALLWQHGAPVRDAYARARRARAVARRCPVRAARGGARGSPPLAGRADPRHGAVHTAPRRRELASCGLRARARRSGATPGSALRESVTQANAPRLWRVSPASTRTLSQRLFNPSRRSHDLRNTIALLEAARRRTLIEHTRFSHGTH